MGSLCNGVHLFGFAVQQTLDGLLWNVPYGLRDTGLTSLRLT